MTSPTPQSNLVNPAGEGVQAHPEAEPQPEQHPLAEETTSTSAGAQTACLPGDPQAGKVHELQAHVDSSSVPPFVLSGEARLKAITSQALATFPLRRGGARHRRFSSRTGQAKDDMTDMLFPSPFSGAGVLSISSGRVFTQPGLHSALRCFPLIGLCRRIHGRVITRVVLVLSRVLIGLLLRCCLRSLVRLLSVRHLLAPSRRLRHPLNSPPHRSFPMFATTEGSAQ